MVNINIPLPTSCASCPLSVSLFGKLYCPAMNDRVGNEGKDSRCPLVDAEGGGDLISRQSLCDALDKAFADRIKMFDYDSYEKADEKTQLVCDGIMRAIDVVLGQPTVDHFADASKKGDLISRADAVDAISKIKRTDNWQAAVSMVLLDLPSAQPDPCVDTIDMLDESIKHFDDMAEECRRNANIERNDYMDLRDDAAEYRQLSTWLNELKWLRERFQLQPERTCVNCGRTVNNGGWYADGGTRCPIEEHYALPKDGYCHLWEKRNVTDDDYPERLEE